MQSLQTASLQEVRKAAARLCRDYLNGKWKEVLEQDLIVKRVSGGLSNFLYYISLPEHEKMPVTQDDEATCPNNMPNEVLLRVYGQTHGGDAFENVITESVVFALLSERNFGPKLYGIFPGGRLEQYIQARALLTHELADTKISQKIALKMAEIHTLNIPMSKEPDWIWNCIARWLNGSESILASGDFSHVNQEHFKFVSNFNFHGECQWLKNFIDKGNYPVMFCHNDMQEGNILIHEESDKNNTSMQCLDGNQNELQSVTNDPELIFIDFEYCAYNYRGFDLANHFVEWTFDYSYPDQPLFAHRPHQYPTQQQRHKFIAAYLRRLAEIEPNTEQGEAAIAKLDYEVQVFTLLSHFLWTLWSVAHCTSNIEFGYWSYATLRINEYLRLKAALQASSQ